MEYSTTPYVGFALDPALHQQVLDTIAAIRRDARQKHLARASADIVAALLHTAVRSFYFDVVNAVPTPASTRRSADAGINTVLKGTLLVVQKMVHTLEPEDLRVFADYMETLMIPQAGGCYVAYPLTPAQATALDEVLARIRQDSNTASYNHLIIDLLCSITDEAIKYFYDTPTRMIKVRSFIKRSADLAIRTVSKGLHYVIRQLFKRTRQRELLMFSRHLQQQVVYVQAIPLPA
jgi:hypothetical protein